MPRTKSGLVVPSAPTTGGLIVSQPHNDRLLPVGDLMAGAGGTIEGVNEAMQAMGFAMDGFAVNHSPAAIKTHQANHPNLKHFCRSVEDFNIAEVVDAVGGWLWLLTAGLPCQHYSRARGGLPINDQMRSHCDLIPHMIKSAHVRWGVLECVPQFVTNGPTCRRYAGHTGQHDEMTTRVAPMPQRCGRPIEERKGEWYRKWHNYMLELTNGAFEARILNAADYGDPQERFRYIAIFNMEGCPIPWPVKTHARKPASDMFGNQQLHNPASSIINWSKIGPSVFDGGSRIRSPKTWLRIAQGAMDFWGPLGPVAVRALESVGLPSNSDIALEAYGAIDGITPVVLRDFSAHDLAPLVMNGQGGAMPREAFENVLPTISGGGYQTLWEPFLIEYNGKSGPRDINVPLPTVVGNDRHSVVEPFLIPHWNERDGQRPRVHAIRSPLPSIHSRSDGLELVQAALGPVRRPVDPRRLVVIDDQTYVLDIRVRGLDVDTELKLAQGFPATYEIHGTRRERLKQVGNAFPVGMARAITVGLLRADIQAGRLPSALEQAA